jgi:DNA adenine methylase
MKQMMTKKLMTKKLRPPVKTHGGKYYLSNWLIQYFPKDYTELTYCEPFCAGASVFLNKLPSSEEMLSDIDCGTINIFKALRDEAKEFITRIKRTRYTERTFTMAQNREEAGFADYIDEAVNEYILRRMSRGGLKKSFAWSDRTRGGQPGDLNAWETMAKQLPFIVDRVASVTVLCEDFREIMKVWDEDNTFFYLDPPYLHSTRSEGSTDTYEEEMTVEDHMELLQLVNNARGKVMLSGYSSPLYNRSLKGWKCRKKQVANHSSQQKKKTRRVECIWLNY